MPSFPATGPNNGNIHTNTSHATDINQSQPANNQQTAPTPQEASEGTSSLFIDNPPKQVTTYPPPHPVIPHARSQPNHNQMGYASDPLTKSRQAFDNSAARLFSHDESATPHKNLASGLATNASPSSHYTAPRPQPNITEFPDKIGFPNEPGNYHQILHAEKENNSYTSSLIPDVLIVITNTNKETGIDLNKRIGDRDEIHIIHCLSQCRKDKKLPGHHISRSYTYSNGASYIAKRPYQDKSITLEKITYRVNFLHNQPSELIGFQPSTLSKTEVETKNSNPSSRLIENTSQASIQLNHSTLPSLPLHNSPQSLQSNASLPKNIYLSSLYFSQSNQKSYPKLATDSPFRTYITEKHSIFGYIPIISYINKNHFHEINSPSYDKLFFDPNLPPGVEVYIENFNRPGYHPHAPQFQEPYEKQIIPKILKSCDESRFQDLSNRVYIVKWGYDSQPALPLYPPGTSPFNNAFWSTHNLQPAQIPENDFAAQPQANPPPAAAHLNAGNLNAVSPQEDGPPQVEKPTPK